MRTPQPAQKLPSPVSNREANKILTYASTSRVPRASHSSPELVQINSRPTNNPRPALINQPPLNKTVPIIIILINHPYILTTQSQTIKLTNNRPYQSSLKTRVSKDMPQPGHGIDYFDATSKFRCNCAVENAFDREMMNQVRTFLAIKLQESIDQGKFVERVGTSYRKRYRNPTEAEIA